MEMENVEIVVIYEERLEWEKTVIFRTAFSHSVPLFMRPIRAGRRGPSSSGVTAPQTKH
jgi:hypothetical protein